MKRIQAIAFDLEGTLIDVEIAHHEGHLEVAAELGLQLSLEEARRTVPGFIGGGTRPLLGRYVQCLRHRVRKEKS